MDAQIQNSRYHDNADSLTEVTHNNESILPSTSIQRMVSQTETLIITEAQTPIEPQALTLTLRQRSSVTWDENTIDNEGLGRKSSKRCCIFHKQRAFGESSSDSDESSNTSSSSSSSDGGGGFHRTTKKLKKDFAASSKGEKKKKNVPDHQRYHA